MRCLLRNLFAVMIPLFVVQPCEAQQRMPAVPKKAVAPAVFKNGIRINAQGFKVSNAFLVFDDQRPVPANNRVTLNQTVNMMVIIESGWTEEGGKAFPGAGEIIKLSNGYEVLKADDLFSAYTASGVAASDARYVTLKAKITEIRNKKHYVIVNFRIWDKKGSGLITGSYKFHII